MPPVPLERGAFFACTPTSRLLQSVNTPDSGVVSASDP